MAGRRDDVLRLEAADGHSVKIPPLAIGTVVDETPGVSRSQMLRAGPASIRLWLDLAAGADAPTVWRDATARLGRYLAAQQLAPVDIVRATEPPWQRAPFGKFRQVIAEPRGGSFGAASSDRDPTA